MRTLCATTRRSNPCQSLFSRCRVQYSGAARRLLGGCSAGITLTSDFTSSIHDRGILARTPCSLFSHFGSFCFLSAFSHAAPAPRSRILAAFALSQHSHMPLFSHMVAFSQLCSLSAFLYTLPAPCSRVRSHFGSFYSFSILTRRCRIRSHFGSFRPPLRTPARRPCPLIAHATCYYHCYYYCINKLSSAAWLSARFVQSR